MKCYCLELPSLPLIHFECIEKNVYITYYKRYWPYQQLNLFTTLTAAASGFVYDLRATATDRWRIVAGRLFSARTRRGLIISVQLHRKSVSLNTVWVILISFRSLFVFLSIIYVLVSPAKRDDDNTSIGTQYLKVTQRQRLCAALWNILDSDCDGHDK